MTISLPEIVRVDSTRRQRTLARRVDVAGFGFWTSRDVVFSFLPADDDSGVRFFRVDLPNSAPIPALVANRIRKPRQTSLAVGDAQVDMIEHVLSALRGAGIDNCDVLVDAPEAPGLDGSAAPFLEAFLEAGAVEQTRERTRLKVVFPGRFGDDSAYVDVLPNAPQTDDESNPNADFNESNDSAEKNAYDFGAPCYEYRLIYDVPRSIPNQMARFDFAPETFRREIAPARTFLTFEEASYLREQGICQRVGVLLVSGLQARNSPSQSTGASAKSPNISRILCRAHSFSKRRRFSMGPSGPYTRTSRGPTRWQIPCSRR